jgi:hypothetical protein
MNLDSDTLAPPQRSVADFMAAAFAVGDDDALPRAAGELEEAVGARLRTFWRGFDRNLATWSEPGFDASDEWWEEKIERFEEAEDEIVEIIKAFDHAFERITARWALSPAERKVELQRARQAFILVVSQLPLASREAREQLISLYGKKRAGRRTQVCESAEEVDRAFVAMGFRCCGSAFKTAFDQP